MRILWADAPSVGRHADHDRRRRGRRCAQHGAEPGIAGALLSDGRSCLAAHGHRRPHRWSPEALLPTLRQRVHELDAELPLASVRTMDEWVSNNAAQPRLNATLLGLFAGVALLIAAIGIYGVLAYSVTQRTREIGLRVALGARPGAVLRLIVGEGMTVGAVGIGIGLLGGLAIGRAVSSLVYGYRPRSGDLRRRGDRAGGGGARRLLDSSAPRGSCRPDGRAARRVE